MDAFDRFWQWADKPSESLLTIPAELRDPRYAIVVYSVATLKSSARF